MLLVGAISTFCHESLGDQRVHITPEMDARGSFLPMAMTGQYSCTFHSPLAERAYENTGDGTPNEWFEDCSSTIQLVTARFIICIHWSSRTEITRRLIDANQEGQGQESYIEHILEVALRLCRGRKSEG